MNRIKLLSVGFIIYGVGGALAMPSFALDHGPNSCYAQCFSIIASQNHPQGACYVLNTAEERNNCLAILKQKTAEICENGCLEDPHYLQGASQFPVSAPQGNHDNPTLYPAQPQPRPNYKTLPTPVRTNLPVSGDRG